MEVRTAGLEHVDGVLALWATSRTAHAVTDDTPEGVERLLRDAPGALLVACDGDEVVGALVAGWDGWRGTMYRLSVRPDRRREGIALALVRAGEGRLRELGCPRVSALVAREDDVANGLWAAAGYEADPVMGRWVRNLPGR